MDKLLFIIVIIYHVSKVVIPQFLQFLKRESVSCSGVSDSLQPHGL